MPQETIELTLIQSSRKRRIAAFLIDHFIVSFLAISIIFLIIGPDFIDKNDFGLMKSSMIIVGIPFFIVYFCKDLMNGISLGRWIIGIMVRDENKSNEIPSKTRLIIRNLFLLIWPIELLVLAINDDKKRLGDKVVKTTVLYNPNKAKKSYRIVSLLVIGFVFFGFTILFSGTALKSSEAYKTAVQNIENNLEIRNEIGGIEGYGLFPTGNINVTNGIGKAGLQIKVIGKTKDLDITVFLAKEPKGEWTVIELRK